MRILTWIAAVLLLVTHSAGAQNTSRTLAAIFAHGDDETSVSPILARYAREGVQVHLIVATDGAQGGIHTTVPRGPELARVRADEARCATAALRINPAVVLSFPDAALGSYSSDPSTMYRLADRLREVLEQLRPDAIITWGPGGATGHPDHRLVSDVVTQLVRGGAPGASEHLFYAYLPAEGMRVVNPLGASPFLVAQPKYFTARISFTPADAEAAARSMACHKTQYSDDEVQRVSGLIKQIYDGVLPLAPAFATDAGTDLFQRPR